LKEWDLFKQHLNRGQTIKWASLKAPLKNLQIPLNRASTLVFSVLKNHKLDCLPFFQATLEMAATNQVFTPKLVEG